MERTQAGGIGCQSLGEYAVDPDEDEHASETVGPEQSILECILTLRPARLIE